ncbi:MAG: NAD(P)/FAD-dependent oxidoreductase [Acidimicrobiales bacterium]
MTAGDLIQQRDLVVVGAGPAGAAAAIVAARAGLSVVLIDKARFPRDKCCGDGLTAAALHELEHLGLQPAAVPSWQPVDRVELHAPSGRTVRLPLPARSGQHSVVARRQELDAALLDVATRAGVELWEGQCCETVEPIGSSSVQVRTVAGRITAPMLIAADGAWSPIRKLCGVDHPVGYRGEWHAFRRYFGGAASQDGEAHRVQHVWFPADLLPGYVWSFPLADGGVNVGYGVLRGRGAPLRDAAKVWSTLLARPEIAAVLGPDLTAQGAMKAWPIPARVGSTALSAHDGRVLFVGDAAAAADPMTGEGIGQALLTGRLAAQVAIDHLGPPGPLAKATDPGVTYGRLVRRHLVADHRLASWCGQLLSSTTGADGSLWLVDRNDWTRRNFARWMFEDYPRALLATPRRWHRGMFTPAGAYRSISRSGGPDRAKTVDQPPTTESGHPGALTK